VKNLYAQFSMKPPGAGSLAERLVGAPGRTTGVAVPVATSRAPVAFYRRTDVPASKPFVRTTYGLGGQNGFSGLGEGEDVVQRNLSLNFGSDTQNASDFFGRDQMWLMKLKMPCGFDPQYTATTNYAPATPKQHQEAAGKWGKLYDIRLTNPAIYAFMVGVQTNINNELRSIEGLGTQGFDILCGKRTIDIETKRINAFRRVQAELARVVAFAPPERTAAEKKFDNELDTLVLQAQVAQNTANIAAGAKNNQTTKPGMSKGPLYAMGAAVLVVGVLVVRKMMR